MRAAKHAAAALLIVVLVATLAPDSRPIGWFRDFNAFYCAGKTITQGRDPYLAQPLAACEHRPKPGGFNAGVKHLSLPAPLPPYALAFFVPFSALPYAWSAMLWSMLLLVALAITIEAMYVATGLPRAALFAAFAPIEGYSCIYLGETAPIAIAAIALATMLFGRGRDHAAAAALGPAFIAPHVGLPAALALFLCSNRSRPVIGLVAALLGIVSYATVGMATTLQYLRDVLPAHAQSEIDGTRQLSLTALLHAFGVPDQLALSSGSTSYIAMLFLGLTLARGLARRNRHDGLVIALPAALVLVGGVFIHVQQMPVALPAALLMFARTRGVVRCLIGAAIVVLAIPWVEFSSLGLIFITVAAGTAFVLARDLLGVSKLSAVCMAVAAGGTLAALIWAFVSVASAPPFTLPPLHPHDLAEVNWGLNIRAIANAYVPLYDLARLPSWLAIASIAIILIGLAHRYDRRGADSTLSGSAPNFEAFGQS